MDGVAGLVGLGPQGTGLSGLLPAASSAFGSRGHGRRGAGGQA